MAAETKSVAVQPLGVFSGVKATVDHTYGHEIRLWRVGSTGRLLGQVVYWDANPEGERGYFDDGTFDFPSGEVKFSVTVIRRDVQPNTRTKAAFRGYLGRGGVWGELRWEGEGAQARGTAGVENLNLLREKSGRLDSFPDLAAWRKAFPD